MTTVKERICRLNGVRQSGLIAVSNWNPRTLTTLLIAFSLASPYVYVFTVVTSVIRQVSHSGLWMVTQHKRCYYQLLIFDLNEEEQGSARVRDAS